MIEYDPCENNEYKDTVEKSVWYRDIELQGCDAIWYVHVYQKEWVSSSFFFLNVKQAIDVNLREKEVIRWLR